MAEAAEGSVGGLVGCEASSSGTIVRGRSKGESVVVDYGMRKSSCGYCRSVGRTSSSHGLWAYSVTVDDYQDLLDQGWRRSGSFLYKPEMERTCCPSYTIRLRASDFLASKDQLRVSKTMQRFLDCTLDANNPVESIEDVKTSKSTCSSVYHKDLNLATKGSTSCDTEKNKEEEVLSYLSDELDKTLHMFRETWDFPHDIQLPKVSVKKISPNKRKLQVEESQILLYSSNISFQLAATLRKKKSDKMDVDEVEMSRNRTEDNFLSPEIIAKKLSDLFTKKVPENIGLSIKASNGHINFYSSEINVSPHESAEEVPRPKRPDTKSKSKGCCLKNTSKDRQGKKRKLEIRMIRSSFDPEEFALYRRYQTKVHNDTPDHLTESNYRRFLVDTPLVAVPPSGDGTVPSCGFGSFHQQYVIDGLLVAVGVVDILPKCLSSKYLFWDPDFAFLSLGKYSALQEIRWVRENQIYCPSLQYYYLGYYIHSCSKMRYKAAYRPSELLCPLRYQWVPFDISKPMLDQNQYAILSDFANFGNSSSLPTGASENNIGSQHDIVRHKADNDFLEIDEQMIDPGFGSSDDESDSENSYPPLPAEIEAGDVSNTLIDLRGSRFRYKDLERAFDPREGAYLKSQLHRYKKAVGSELSERMVYSLG